MATTQQYSLRWNNYFRHLTTSLDYLRTNDDFVDVSLFCDGRKIKAHKVVLSSCSGYFKEIFKENPHPHPVIIFKFIKFEDLNSIIQFMYQGEVNVQQDALQSFLQTAELLAVQGLTAEEKEKKTSLAPLIAEQKLSKTIPSTIRPLNDVSLNTATTTTTTQTIEIPTATLIQNNNVQQQQQQQQLQQHHTHKQHQQPQIQHIQIQHTTPSQQQQIHHSVQQIPQPQQTQTNQHNQQQQQQQQQQIQSQQIQLASATNISNSAMVTIPVNALQQQQQHQQQHQQKKRKITFSDDENIYTTDAVDDTTLVKIKMDIPGYIISEVDESQHLSDSSGHANTQDNTNASGGNVAQYPSEYEILTESEVEEKYNQNDTEISLEMNRLLDPAGSANTQDTLEDVANTTTMRNEGKSADLPNNKWTECQFCKMVITTVNLWRHIRTQHTPQPPRKCEICNKNFKNKYSLREHIRISHEQKIAVKTEN